VVKELQEYGAEAAAEAVDVANAADHLFIATQRLEQKLGKIDVWINDAMLTVFSPVAE
jgi:NADP-dependent 3-hydroxy acid dehydrogenase YdfG